jgi:hypothetical protein
LPIANIPILANREGLFDLYSFCRQRDICESFTFQLRGMIPQYLATVTVNEKEHAIRVKRKNEGRYGIEQVLMFSYLHQRFD